MARFDIYKYDAKNVPFVVDVQSGFLDILTTRVVIPLVRKEIMRNEIAYKLKPVIVVNSNEFILMTTDISAVRTKDLGPYVTNIEADHRQIITDTLDFLFQGF